MLGLIVLMLIAGGLLIVLMTVMLVRGITRPPRHTDGYALARGLPTDPGEAGFKFTVWSLDRPDGTASPVWDIDLERDEKAAPLTVVMVHGWGQSKIDMLARVNVFADIEQVWRIIIYDRRGHGDDSAARATLGAADDDDLVALLDRLGDHEDRVLIIGYSMGAQVALRAVAKMRRADRDQQQVTLAGVIAEGVFEDFRRSLRNRLQARGYPTRPMTDLALLWLRLTGRGPRSVLAVAPQVTVPVLVIHGSEDETAAPDEAKMIADQLPDARYVELDDAGHLDAHERSRDVYEREVRAFVRQCADPKPSAHST